ncbi:hypothetical protein LU689_05560 [Pseudomonas asiatica]|uniref:hypothetical protein n=1 Tax=Pseudomonas asiatica TaxID=2219225 RepID=UPI001E47E1AF|nr:hypothetical protein [Pseudomonas asiatica]MCE0849380.1 hypothetical protein [Pseudomonas asiatica]
MWPFSAETTQSIYTYASIVTIIAALATAVCGALVYISSTFIGKETEMKIENARAVGALANESAQSANLKAERLRSENLQLSIALEKETQSRMKLEARLGQRTLSPVQIMEIKELNTKEAITGKVLIKAMLPQPEIIQYANILSETLSSSGIQTEVVQPGNMNWGMHGVSVAIKPSQEKAILTAIFEKIGAAIDSEELPDNYEFSAVVYVHPKQPHL